MRRSVAAFLESRICRDTILMDGKPEAANALQLLRWGVVYGVQYHHGQLLACVLPSHHHAALTDAPIDPVSPDDEPYPSNFLRSGDLAGCQRQLTAAIARANERDAAGSPSIEWPDIAIMCRFLTGDDEAARQHLRRRSLFHMHGHWVTLFGLAAVQREKETVLDVIERAFDGVKFPGPEHLSLYQAQAADEWASCDQARDHKGRWQDLPRQQIMDCQWALPHLDGRGMQYYLPALMSFAVRESDGEDRAAFIFYALECLLRFKDRFGLFTHAQLGAVARFAELHDDVTAMPARASRACADR